MTDSIDPGWSSHFVDIGGVKLNYIETGKGPVLLCLHGTSMSAHCWGHLAARLKDSFRVIALNMRGHGASDRPQSAYTIAEYADDVVAFAAALGIDKLSIIGSSVGTQVATATAALSPALVDRLILSDPSFWVSDAEILKYLRSHHRRQRRYPTREEIEAFCMALPQRSGLSPEMHRLAMQGDFRRDPDGWWAWAYDLPAITKTFLNLSVDMTEQIRATKAPVLILNADRSNVLSGDDAAKLLHMFPNAILKRVENCNHTIWGDQPELLAREARSFLS